MEDKSQEVTMASGPSFSTLKRDHEALLIRLILTDRSRRSSHQSSRNLNLIL